MTAVDWVLPSLAQLRRRATELVAVAGTGRTSSTAYDTAHLAALRTGTGRALFPDSVEWLRRSQHIDGSWGSSIPVVHDRLVSTLAAVVALTGVDEPWARPARTAGSEFIQREAGNWAGAFPDTIGFELVVPRLLERARAVGTALPYDALIGVEQVRAAKLAKIPSEMLFDNLGNVAFSAEFLSGHPAAQLRKLKSRNGSYACSPSASAAAWSTTNDADTWAYLLAVTNVAGDGGAPAIYPMDVFDRAWVLGPLVETGLVERADAHLRYLLAAVGPQGAAASVVGPAPDADTTAMSILVAHGLGADVRPLLDSLLAYEADDRFRCFAFERDPSISANARVAHALRLDEHRFTAQIAKVDRFLAENRDETGSWHDKWHLSPYYTTSVVAAGGLHRPWSWRATRRWLMDTQHPDGSWGIAGGSREETAYGLDTLCRLEPAPDENTRRSIAAAAHFLSVKQDEDPAELWVAKSLYAPLHVIEAGVIGALARAASTLAGVTAPLRSAD
jgi:halimadienyl-diphosphate synthase